MNTKFIGALVLIFLSLASSISAQEKIKIGVSTALTGNAATYGVDLKNALLFANEKLAGNKYELVFEDDRCNGRDAVAVAHRFIDVLKLKYVAGFACSSTVLSSASLYEKAQVVVMVASASAAEISNSGDFIFRTWASDDGAARTLHRYIASNHKSVGIISEQTDYAQGFLKSFIESNNDKKLNIASESYLTDTVDFRSSLLKLRARNIDGLFINSQTEVTLLAVLKQVKEMNWNVQVYSAYWGGASSFLEKAKSLAEGIIYVDLPSVKEALTSDGALLFNEFQKKYGKINSVELMFATAFEAFRALHMAIESGQEMRRYLYSTKFDGLFGEWWFDSHGEIQGLNFIMKVVKDGKGVLLN